MTTSERDRLHGKRIAWLVARNVITDAAAGDVIAAYALSIYNSGRRINQARLAALAGYESVLSD